MNKTEEIIIIPNHFKELLRRIQVYYIEVKNNPEIPLGSGSLEKISSFLSKEKYLMLEFISISIIVLPPNLNTPDFLTLNSYRETFCDVNDDISNKTPDNNPFKFEVENSPKLIKNNIAHFDLLLTKVANDIKNNSLLSNSKKRNFASESSIEFNTKTRSPKSMEVVNFDNVPDGSIRFIEQNRSPSNIVFAIDKAKDKRKLSATKTESAIETESGTLQKENSLNSSGSKNKTIQIQNHYIVKYKQLTRIKDKKGSWHIVAADDIDQSDPKRELTDIDTNESFVPKEKHVQFFNPYNELTQIFQIKNARCKLFYTYFMNIKHLIKSVFRCVNIAKENLVYDIYGREQMISAEEVYKLISLTSIGKCLFEKEEYLEPREHLITVDILDEDFSIQISNGFLKKVINDIINKRLINWKFSFTSPVTHEHKYTTLSKIRPHNPYRNKQEPYRFVTNEEKCLFKVNNLVTKKKEKILAKEITEIILSNQNKIYATNRDSKYLVEELKLSLQPQNESNSYILTRDLNSNIIVVKKEFLLSFVNELYLNKNIPSVGVYKGKSIPLELILRACFEVNPKVDFSNISPGILDRIPIPSEKPLNSTPSLESQNDLFDFATLKDIFNNSFLIRKPYLRKVLSEEKDFTTNKIVYDTDGYQRVISLMTLVKINS